MSTLTSHYPADLRDITPYFIWCVHCDSVVWEIL